jgi:hypothetical protein
MRVEDSFLFGFVRLSGLGVSADDLFNMNYHNQVLRAVSWIVVVLMLGAFVAAWVARKRRSALWMPLVVVGACVCVLQLRWSGIVWRLAPELKYLQFPWRWMLALGMVVAALTGLALRGEAMTRRAIAVRAAGTLLLAGGMAVVAALFFWQPCDEEDNVGAQVAAFHAKGFEGTDEYTPQNADYNEIQEGLPAVSILNAADAGLTGLGRRQGNSQGTAAAVKIERWDMERRAVMVNSSGTGFAVLRLMDSRAWRVLRNGVEVRDRVQRSDGLMAIPVEAGANEIDVRWRRTSDQWAGDAVSIVSLAITLALVLNGRRRFDGESFR